MGFSNEYPVPDVCDACQSPRIWLAKTGSGNGKRRRCECLDCGAYARAIFRQGLYKIVGSMGQDHERYHESIVGSFKPLIVLIEMPLKEAFCLVAQALDCSVGAVKYKYRMRKRVLETLRCLVREKIESELGGDISAPWREAMSQFIREQWQIRDYPGTRDITFQIRISSKKGHAFMSSKPAHYPRHPRLERHEWFLLNSIVSDERFPFHPYSVLLTPEERYVVIRLKFTRDEV